VLAFASAWVTAYWLLGGTLGLDTVGGEIEEQARERSTLALAGLGRLDSHRHGDFASRRACRKSICENTQYKLRNATNGSTITAWSASPLSRYVASWPCC
jgi:hypothetical protein